jgi:predicted SprT family Zn-dependent metalloprotease
MKIADARYLADCLIDTSFTINGKSYKARDIGYKFEWMNRKRALGLCNYRTKTILLSEDYVFNNSIELVKDTILHELAHAFSYFIYGSAGAGHNSLWRNVCRQIEAKPQRCKTLNDGLVPTEGKYILRHKDTHEVFSHYHKWPSKLYNQLSQTWIRGRQLETKGKLELVPNNSWSTI